MKKITFLLFSLTACGQKKDESIPVDMQLDFAVSQQAINNLQPGWQKAQQDYSTALANLQAFCRAHGDKVPGGDPTNGKRLACVPKSKGKK